MTQGGNDMAGAVMQIGISRSLQRYIAGVRTGHTTDEKVNLLIVEGLFLSGEVTLEKAAELAGMPLLDFMDVLKEQNIPWGSYSEEEYNSDLAALSYVRENS